MSGIHLDIDRVKMLLAGAVEKLETVFPFAQALFTHHTGLKISLTERETTILELSPMHGVVLSAFNGRWFVEAATPEVSEKALAKAIDKIMAHADGISKEIILDPGTPWNADFKSGFEIDPVSLSFREKLDRLRERREFMAGLSDRIVSAVMSYRERVVRKVYVNRTRRLYQELLHTDCVPVVIVSDGKTTRVLHGGNGRQAGFETALISDEKLRELVENTEKLLEAQPVDPGTYTVVGGPGLAGVIAHEAFGHGVESDMFLKKRAKAAEYMNRMVASEKVTLLDAPETPGQSGSYFFDDEGVKAGTTSIIENGVLKNVLTDRISAAELGFPLTGNGRRESFSHKTYVRMSNTFFAAGDSDLEEMIASVEKGLYMPDGSNGMEDPKNWGIQVESPYAIEIKNGALTNRRFTPIVITGFVPELLKSITMVGKKVEFSGLGVCQKGHKEQVQVAIGGPCLKMTARVG